MDAVGRGFSRVAWGASDAVEALRGTVYDTDEALHDTYENVMHAMFVGQETGPRAATDVDSVGYQRLHPFFGARHPAERLPVACRALTTSHPDTVLRRLGIIKQFGRRSARRIYFNAHFQHWRYVDDETPIPDDKFVKGEASLSSRVDTTPSAVVHIVGTTNLLPLPQHDHVGGTPTKSSGDYHRTAAQLKDHERLAMKDIARRSKFSAERSGPQKGDTQSRLVESDEQKRYIQQYLSVSVPVAALRTDAVIVVAEGESEVAKYVSSGVAVQQGERIQHHDSRKLQAVGLFHVPEEDEQCPTHLTHQIFLERSTICRKAPRKYREECQEWDPAPEAIREDGAKSPSTQSGDGVDVPVVPATEAKTKYGICCRWCGNALVDHLPIVLVNAGVREYMDWAAFANVAPETMKQGGDLIPTPLARILLNRYIARCVPLRQERHAFLSRLIDTLAAGQRPGLDVPGRCSRTPPVRAAIPVTVILVGGDPQTTKYYLAQCISRRYSVIVVEGSGGYADVLCSIRRRIATAFERSGTDELRKFTTAVDPLTAEILSATDLLRIVPVGTSADEMTREIEGSLRGDKALKHAWETFALWSHNALREKRQYHAYYGVVMFLNLLVTFITVLQTFIVLRLVGAEGSEPATYPNEVDEYGVTVMVFWTMGRWSIIILPVVVSLIQALMNKWDPAAKWVELRTASQRLLSEIYRYRTNTGQYSDEELNRQRKGLGLDQHGDGDAEGADGSGTTTSRIRSYASKEDLLQQYAKELDQLLTRGSVRSLALSPYSGPLPPEEVLSVDDGFSWLSPDQYIKVRCDAWTVTYTRSSAYLEGMIQFGRMVAYIFGALGTALAAIAAYQDGSLQAWVAFTTAMVTTATTVVETSRMEQIHQKENNVVGALQNISAWWASLGPRADSRKNRDMLVDQVEKQILDEIDFWALQVKAAMGQGKKKKSEEGGTDGAGAAGGSGPGDTLSEGLKLGEDLETTQEEAATKKELEDFSPDSFKNLLAEGDTALLEKAKQLQLKMSAGTNKNVEKIAREEAEVLERIQREAKEKQKKIIDGLSALGECVSVIDQVSFGSIYAPRAASQELIMLYRNPMHRKHFINSVLGVTHDKDRDSPHCVVKAKHLSPHAIQGSLPDEPLLNRLKPTLEQRTIVEISLGFVSAEMMSYCLEVADNYRRQKGVEIQLQWSMLIPEGSDPQDFLCELKNLHRIADIQHFSFGSILRLVEDQEISTKLINLSQAYPEDDGEGIFRQLLVAAETVFSTKNPLSHLFHQSVNLLSEIDVDEMLLDPKNPIYFTRALDEVAVRGIPVKFLTKESLLQAFPPKLRSAVRRQSQVQLARYLNDVLKGKPSLSVIYGFFEQFHRYIPQNIQTALSSRDAQVRFVASVETLTQNDICSSSKARLLKKLSLSQSFGEDLEEALMSLDAEELRVMLSSIQAKNSNTYPAQVVDQVANLIVSFDLKALIDFESCHRLVLRIANLASKFAPETPKETFLQLLSSRTLAETFDRLSQPQLLELFIRTRAATTVGWTKLAVLADVLDELQELWGPHGKYRRQSAVWSTARVVRFFWVVEILCEEEIAVPSDTGVMPTVSSNEASPKQAVAETKAVPSCLTIASDQLVMLSFQTSSRPIPPGHIQRFFHALWQRNVDVEIGEAFEAVINTGYSLEIVEEFSKLLHSAAARRRLVNSVAILLNPEYETELLRAEEDVFPSKYRGILQRVPPEERCFPGEECEEFADILSPSSPLPRRANSSFQVSTTAPGSPTDFEGDTQASLYRDFTLNLFFELKYSCSVRIFLALARRCRFFDLRELFGCVEDRAALAALLTLGCMIPPPRLDNDSTDNSGSMQSLFPTLEGIASESNTDEAAQLLEYHQKALHELMVHSHERGYGGQLVADYVEHHSAHHHRSDRRASTTPSSSRQKYVQPQLTAKQWKKRFMARCADLGSRGLESIKPLLNYLSAPQLRWLCIETSRLLTSTTLGLFSESYIRQRDQDTSLCHIDPNNSDVVLGERIAFDTALHSLRELSARNPTQVREALNKMDPEKFIRRKPADRAAMLSKVMTVGTDMPRSLIAHFPDQMCRDFFSILSLALPDEDRASQDELRQWSERQFMHLITPSRK